MTRFLARRVLTTLVSLVLASVVVFGAVLAVPGDPAAVILGMNAAPEALAAVREQLGLDVPAPQRYLRWLGGVLRGDLGESIQYQRPVARLIGDRLGVSLPLTLAAALLATLVAVPVGIATALKRGTVWDPLLVLASQVGAAIPSFWLGLLLILVFAVGLGWLPSGGFPGWDVSVGRSLRALVLPVLALGLGQAAVMTRMTRAAMLDVLSQDFVRTARAKGLARRAVVGKHALRNALVTLVTVLGLTLVNVFVGAIVVEQVFSLPGIGRLALTAIGNRDYPLVQGVVLLYASAIVLMSFLVDLSYGWLDPRIRYA
ncbi:MAG: ABC transporter permease [Trueperaceae bacterium]|nr:ABC transporter permease [Trueperaceae bacterium]